MRRSEISFGGSMMFSTNNKTLGEATVLAGKTYTFSLLFAEASQRWELKAEVTSTTTHYNYPLQLPTTTTHYNYLPQFVLKKITLSAQAVFA